MSAPKISAVSIKRLFYGDTSLVTTGITGSDLYALIQKSKGENPELKEVRNIHQDTWTFEESDANQDSYRNQLTGAIYRMGVKTMGEVTLNWTIGQYDYHTKADFLGGNATDTTWERPRGIVEIYKTLIAVTEDDQYIVIPKAAIKAKEANTDKAIGISIVGTAMEPENENISSEYWFDSSEVIAKA